MMRLDKVMDLVNTSPTPNEGVGNAYGTQFRLYDPRIGRWFSLDPLRAQFPWVSPYVGMGNNPVLFVDQDGDSIKLGNLLDKDKNGNFKYRQDIQAFEAFAMTKEGQQWISDRAQAGFSYDGQIYKDLKINITNEGVLSKKGIDYIFDFSSSNHNKTRADIKDQGDRVSINVYISGYSYYNNYFETVFSKLGTFLHEAGYHGNSFEKQFLSGNYELKGASIKAITHNHYTEPCIITENSIRTSFFGLNGFSILSQFSLKNKLYKTKIEILNRMRVGFNEYSWPHNDKSIDNLIRKK